MKQWIEQEADDNSVLRLKKELGISYLLARLLVQRGLTDLAQAEKFLNPKLKHLDDPFAIDQMECAINRIFEARDKKQKILLVGDYDVDGITSTVMTKLALLSIGLSVETVTPKRLSEGYGLTREVLKRGLGEKSFSLVIALDCGTNSINEAHFLKEQGIDLVIVDHHQLKSETAPSAILVNPHLQEDKGEPWRNLCTAGLCFKLIHALYIKAREIKIPRADELTPRDFLPLCAIGTLADLVPLIGESRIFSHFGMKRLFLDASPGLLALLQECGLDGSVAPETEDITYKLAPRINACGRLNEPENAVSLLLEKDLQTSKNIALKLTRFNEERKGIEAQLTSDALALAEKNFTDQPAVVVTGEGDAWHPGVVGIVAGKLANALNKPCLVLAKDSEGEYCGSGRGVTGVNLVEVLAECQDFLTHWGGHPVAVGLGLKAGNLDAFISQFLDAIQKASAVSIEEPAVVSIDVIVSPKELNFKLLDEINSLGPFGQENPEPTLGLVRIKLEEQPRKISNGEHFQFSLHNGQGFIRGIAWRMGDKIPPTNKEIDLAFKLRRNHWYGKSSLQLVLDDWKFSD